MIRWLKLSDHTALDWSQVWQITYTDTRAEIVMRNGVERYVTDPKIIKEIRRRIETETL